MKTRTHLLLLTAAAVWLSCPVRAGGVREVLGNRGRAHTRFAPRERLAYTFSNGNAYTATVRRVSAGYGGAEVVESRDDGASVAVISVYTPNGERHEARDLRKGLVHIAVRRPDGTIESQVHDLAAQGPATQGLLHVPQVFRSEVTVTPEPAALWLYEAVAPPIRAAASGVTVDLMIVADTGARAWADAHGGGLEAVANAAVTRLNAALANSGVACSVRLVQIYEPGYTYTEGSGGLSALLTRLQRSEGGLSGVGSQRNLYRADIVSMLVDTGSTVGTTGMGYESISASYAYSVCSVRTTSTGHTMSHEVGHNFGCGHSKDQRDSPGPGIYSYAAGWYFNGTNGKPYHTIMGYNYDGYTSTSYLPCDYFSTPLKSYAGRAVGHATDGDNARCISQTMATVAAHRTAVAVCAVTFDAQGGTVAPTQMDAVVGAHYGALPVPSRTSHLFDGWWTAPGGGGTRVTADTTVPSTSSQTLYAKWLATYTLTVREGTIGSFASATNVLAGTVLTVHARDKTMQGLLFDMWVITPFSAALGAGFNPKAMTNTFAMPAQNVTLTASYAVAPGYLRVCVRPEHAQGIWWSMDNGKIWAAANTGEAFPASPGSRTIIFRSLSQDWLAPQKQTVHIAFSTTNTVTAVALAPRAVGTFSGWLADSDGHMCGTLAVTIGATGKTTAKAALSNRTFSLTAPAWAVNAAGDFAATLMAKKGETLTLALDVAQPFGAFPAMTGILTGGAFGTGTYSVHAQRNAYANKKDPDYPTALMFLAPRAGYYTVSLASNEVVAVGEAAATPEGHGYLGVTVDAKKGTAKTAGKLPNGTAVSCSATALIADTRLLVPAFAPLYSKRGIFSGLLTIEDAHITGDTFWLYPGKKPTAKPPQTADRFALTCTAEGGRYVMPISTNAIFAAAHPDATETEPIAEIRFTIDGKGKAQVAKTSDTLNNPQKVSLTLTPKTGIFKGKFTVLQDGKNVSVTHEGIFVPGMDDAALGAGFWLLPDKRSFSVTIKAD